MHVNAEEMFSDVHTIVATNNFQLTCVYRIESYALSVADECNYILFKTNMPSKLIGKWKLVKDENFDNYMKEIGEFCGTQYHETIYHMHYVLTVELVIQSALGYRYYLDKFLESGEDDYF